MTYIGGCEGVQDQAGPLLPPGQCPPVGFMFLVPKLMPRLLYHIIICHLADAEMADHSQLHRPMI